MTPPFEKSEQSVFFITGTMRSGTSLLADLLYSRLTATQRHPKIVSSMEGMPKFRTQLAKLVALIAAEESGADHPESRDSTEAKKKKLIEALISGLKSQLELISGTSISADMSFGVKYTNINLGYHDIKREFEKSKMILMYRDPRDVFASHKFRKFKSSSAVQLSIVSDILLMDSYYGDPGEDSSVLQVKYEELTDNTRSELARVIAFLGHDPADFDWDSLSRGLLNNSSFGDDHQGGQIKVVGEVVKSPSRYKRFLSSSEIQFIELLMGDWMVKRGYALEQHGDLAMTPESLLKIYLPHTIESTMRFNGSLDALENSCQSVGRHGLYQEILKSVMEERKE